MNQSKPQKSDEILISSLTAATKRHIAPVFRVNPHTVIIHGTDENMVGQGTITFITYKGHCFGITNQHVTQNSKKSAADTAFMLALQKHIPMPGRLIFTSRRTDSDFPYDLSVFVLNESFVRSGGKIPAPLIHEDCPIVEDFSYMAAGYPGHKRGRLNDMTSHPIYHIVATCRSISDRMLILQDELPPSSEAMCFGGISGGAIFNISDDGTYSVAGIIFEGRGQHDDVEQRGSNSDIWVYGIPITTKWMDRILEDVQTRNVSLDVQPAIFCEN